MSGASWPVCGIHGLQVQWDIVSNKRWTAIGEHTVSTSSLRTHGHKDHVWVVSVHTRTHHILLNYVYFFIAKCSHYLKVSSQLLCSSRSFATLGTLLFLILYNMLQWIIWHTDNIVSSEAFWNICLNQKICELKFLLWLLPNSFSERY